MCWGVMAGVAPWVAIALHERKARKSQPWQAVGGEDGRPLVREAQAGRRFVRARRGREERWIPAEAWSWGEREAEAGGIAGRLGGAVRSHLPALLGGGHDSTVAEALAAQAEREARREERADAALALREAANRRAEAAEARRAAQWRAAHPGADT
jgi:hypothetical protein